MVWEVLDGMTRCVPDSGSTNIFDTQTKNCIELQLSGQIFVI